MDKGGMLLVYKILLGFLEGVQWQNFCLTADTSRLRGHPLKPRKDRSRLDMRKFTFSKRVVNMWNDLAAEVVTASSVKSFKNKLEAPSRRRPSKRRRRLKNCRMILRHKDILMNSVSTFPFFYRNFNFDFSSWWPGFVAFGETDDLLICHRCSSASAMSCSVMCQTGSNSGDVQLLNWVP